MERLLLILIVMCCYLYSCKLVLSGQAIESPQYKVVHSESDFELRQYRESSWMSALVRETTSFEKATKDGFHRLYQYIHGANLNTSEITMTAPVLTSIVPSVHGPAEYYVRLYLPAKYERTPPQPSSDLNLQFDKWRSHCIAVRKFTGFAKDDHVHKEFETLVNSLNKHLNGKPAILEDKSSYAIAQYNASYHLSGRLNEVWMDLSGFTSDC
ncbi:PREDICTED: heme-binding protein 2-like [Prunus mume]|uniref:Heme-binding protein 2-like n=1 Tax=Prunus mume TaxID=102107 RepID=A0ABM0PW48_PRUMU|nr:PREDICTED: heme-binding protein 2-like [Prunus mume]